MISHATRMPPNEQELTVTQSGVTSVQSAPGEGEAQAIFICGQEGMDFSPKRASERVTS